MAPPTDYDVVVLGGGPAGCATAIGLRRRGISAIMVAEAGPLEPNHIGESIPPDTGLLLARLGLQDDFLKEGHEPCFGSCSSWGDAELGFNDFLFNPLGNGWHLNRKRFNAFLVEKTIDDGVDLHTATRFEGSERIAGNGFRLHLTEGAGATRTVSTRFVVDATGMRSAFARRQGAKRRFLDILVCVYGFFEVPVSSEFSKLTLLEAVDYGWWYAARLPDGGLAVAVATDAEIVKQLALRNPQRWLARLEETHHLAGRMSGCRFIENTLLVCPAPSFLMDSTAGSHWLTVGDAASAYDPISSQGIHKALSDGLQAADVIGNSLAGAADGLREYRLNIADRFDQYLKNRNYLYGLENRWPDSPFWKRRHERRSL